MKDNQCYCKITDDGSINSFCASLDEEDRLALCEHCSRRQLSRGQGIVRGDFSTAVYIVTQGMLVTDYVSEDEAIDCSGLNLYGPGYVFSCELICYTDNPEEYPLFADRAEAAAEALTRVVLGRVPLSAMRSMFESRISFAKKLFQVQMDMYGNSCELAAVLRGKNAERALKHILRLIKKYNVELTHQQIADIIGRDRTTVSRLMPKLLKDQSEKG